MNGNINEQNNQEMNNTFLTNGSETFANNATQPTNQQFMNNNNIAQPTNQQFMNNNITQPTNQQFTNNNNNIAQPTNQQFTNNNNIAQPTNQQFMNNNNIAQPTNQQFMNNNNIAQPTNQQFMNNNFDGNNSLNYNQNNFNNVDTSSYALNNNGKDNNKIKKIIIISAIILGIVAVILVVIGLLTKSPKTSVPNSPGTPSAKKTLTCTVNVGMAGVYYVETYEYYINDGSASLKQTRKTDLKKTQLESEESQWAQSWIDGTRETCSEMSECEFSYHYSKGKYLETTLLFGEGNFNEAVQGLTAQEIYDQQKAKHESGKIDGLVYTCSGNGSESTETNNQSVYKTIDFNSYTGDSNSKEFDLLINRRVTFTNVPTLGGYLGTLTKGISCRNESSFTIEDDVEYTVTGIVTHNTGTYSIGLKDCTITKN